ncbi:MAG: hypothetical protein R6X35_15025, partial [Candidatus Krumholzibacteriia bacterium]
DHKWIEGLGSGGFTAPAREARRDGGPVGQLYDLAADPGARVNLRFAQPELYNDLVGRLQAVLRSGAWLAGAAPVADLSPEDLKTLKSLGYL